MNIPSFTLEDIDSDLRRLRLGRNCLGGLARCIEGEGRNPAPLLELIDSESWIADRLDTIARQIASERGTNLGGFNDALAFLGADWIARLSLVAWMQRILGGPERAYGWSSQEHWSHAIFSACIAESIAEELNAPRGAAFAAGFCHGLGRFFLSWHCGRWGVRLENPGAISSAQLREEATRFGMNQCDAAGAVLARLGFSEAVHVPTRWFWYPQFAGELSSSAERLQASVELALVVRTQASGSAVPWESLHPAQRHILSRALPRVRLARRALAADESSRTRPPMATAA